MGSCPDVQAVIAFASGELAEQDAERLEEHVDACAECAALVAHAVREVSRPAVPATLTQVTQSSGGSHPQVRPLPARVGRYAVLRLLGSGGMGRVVAALDPRLQRTVAIKLLDGTITARDAAELRARMRREGRALASLDHPHVVRVFDVGETDDGGHPFVAMELVDGVTLHAWIAARPRSENDILRALIQAGRGLAAAHDAGIVHRDFKPANVMVDGSGRAVVLDFGLAREPIARGTDPSLASGGASASASAWTMHTASDSAELTEAGIVMGTPSYMAPEQHVGRTADARADQFAFCATAWEALSGERAFFVARTDDARADMKRLHLEKTVRGPWTAGPRAIPRRIAAVLRRGLSPRPEDRFADMHALLHALGRARHPVGRRLGLPALALGATLAVAMAARSDPAVTSGCDDEAARVSELWTPARRDAIERAFMATEAPFAADMWRSVHADLDAWVAAWSASHDEACAPEAGARATALELQRLCLARARAALVTTLDRLEEADARIIERALGRVAALPSPTRCAEVGEDEAARAPDPEIAAQVDALRTELDAVAAEAAGGMPGAALARAESLVDRARALSHPPLTAAALVLLGRVLEGDQDIDGAEAAFAEAAFMAAGIGADAIAIDAATSLASLLAHRKADHEAARTWIRNAQAWLDRGARSEVGEADIDHALGALHSGMGDYDRAEQHFRRAFEARLRLDGEDALSTAAALSNLGHALLRQERWDEALDANRRALAIDERRLGPHHPDVAHVLGGLGNIHLEMGHLDDALKAYQRAYEIDREALPPGHHNLGRDLKQLAMVLHSMERLPEAKERYEQALAIYRRTRGEEYLDVAAISGNLGILALDLEDYELALRSFDTAAATLERLIGSHYDLGLLHGNRARALLGLDRVDEARAAAEKAVEITEATIGRSHSRMATALESMATVLERQGDIEGALARLDEALRINTDTRGADHPITAGVRDEIARLKGASPKGARSSRPPGDPL